MVKQIFFLSTILLGVCRGLNAQGITPEKLGFKAYRIADRSLGEVNYYVCSKNIDQEKPLLLYLDGSGPYPLFQQSEKGMGSSFVIYYKNLSNEYHVLVIS